MSDYRDDALRAAQRQRQEELRAHMGNDTSMWVAGAVGFAIILGVLGYAASTRDTNVAENRPTVTETRSTTGAGTTTPQVAIERSTTGSGATSPAPKAQEKPANPAAPGQTPPATNR
jgi:hypothetical protein